jgi:hypothetical protein
MDNGGIFCTRRADAAVERIYFADIQDARFLKIKRQNPSEVEDRK